ncbi:hypothetical protein RCL_jg4683.t1 [Rhizophagus clarus]|uniref:Uncharacterized protein n=1 Tax=Rhizophagus clarus TaxID=94130 RepID=A0A8H3QJC7_9GLOM|nr:hypothetical protein RCL_jg4683.t1 [Rhizophagus clarus]
MGEKSNPRNRILEESLMKRPPKFETEGIDSVVTLDFMNESRGQFKDLQYAKKNPGFQVFQNYPVYVNYYEFLIDDFHTRYYKYG